jgi:hypothetical protein
MWRCRRTIVSCLAVSMLYLAAPFHRTLAQDAMPNAAPPAQDSAGSTAISSDQSNQLCTVAGTVTSLATGEPLKRTQVFLSAETGPAHNKPAVALTDAAGHFAFENVKPGRYGLAVMRDGYIPSEYGESDASREGSLLTLTAGQRMTDLIFRLQKYAVITGRVVDEDGEPMIRVSVTAMRLVRRHGANQLEQASNSAQTDDEGTYRIFELEPGRYVICADPSAGRSFGFGIDDSDGAKSPDPTALPNSQYALLYYPGATEGARAAVLDVKAGEEVPRIDFSFAPSPPIKGYQVRGRVVNVFSEKSQGFVTVTAVPSGGDSTSNFEPAYRFAARPDRSTGAFTLVKVPPGNYVVVANWLPLNGGTSRSATKEVTVANADVDGVSLVLTAGANISGKVSLEGSVAAPEGSIRVQLQPRGSAVYADGAEANMAKDGTFTLTGVHDGTYSLAIESKCKECYIKAATANSTDALAGGVVVSEGQGPESLAIVYSSNTGRVTGTVSEPNELPAPGAYVLAYLDTGTNAADLPSHSARSDQNGRFELRGLPPGNYHVIAFEKLDPDFAEDSTGLAKFNDAIQSFDIGAGSSTALRLQVVPASRMDTASQ